MKKKLFPFIILAFLSVICLSWYFSNQKKKPFEYSNTDMNMLAKFINFPKPAKSVVWQTGTNSGQENDWWILAILEIDPADRGQYLVGSSKPEYFEFPSGFDFTISFGHLDSIERSGFTIDAFGVEPFAKSPLLNGTAFSLSPNHVVVYLWTM